MTTTLATLRNLSANLSEGDDNASKSCLLCGHGLLVTSRLGAQTSTPQAFLLPRRFPCNASRGESWLNHLNRSFGDTGMGKTGRPWTWIAGGCRASANTGSNFFIARRCRPPWLRSLSPELPGMPRRVRHRRHRRKNVSGAHAESRDWLEGS